RIDVGIHAHGDRGGGAARARNLLQRVELLRRLDVEARDADVERLFHLRRRLADAAHHDAIGPTPGEQHAAELAAAHDVEARAAIREQAEHGEVRERLHREADEMVDGREGFLEDPEMPEQRRLAVDVRGRAELRRDRLERAVLRMEDPVLVREVVHQPARPNARWSTRIASSARSSATTHAILISLVDTIWMSIPTDARASNASAATPGWLRMPAPTIDTFATFSSVSTPLPPSSAATLVAISVAVARSPRSTVKVSVHFPFTLDGATTMTSTFTPRSASGRKIFAAVPGRDGRWWSASLAQLRSTARPRTRTSSMC